MADWIAKLSGYYPMNPDGSFNTTKSFAGFYRSSPAQVYKPNMSGLDCVLHDRTRRRHQPGSGPYMNRRVFGGSVTCQGCTVKFEQIAYSGANYNVDGWKLPAYQYWDGSRYIYTYLECRSSGKRANQWWIYTTSMLITPGVVIKRTWANISNLRYNWKEFCVGTRDDMTRGSAFSRLLTHYKYLKGIPLKAASISPDYSVGSVLTYSNFNTFDAESLELVFDAPRFSSEWYNRYQNYTEGIPLGGTVEHLIAGAYVDAVDNLPHVSNMNNVENILDLFSALVKLLLSKGKKIDVSSLLSVPNLWLKYRYAYCTTRADLDDVMSYCERIANVGSSVIVSNGYRFEDNVTARASISGTSHTISDIVGKVRALGLGLTPYNAWDLVPYSFIIDWFLDIGSLLEFAEKRNTALEFDEEAWCSYEFRGLNEYGYNEIFYHRMYYQPNLLLSQRTVYEPSGRVITKRVADTFALISNS